MCRDRLPDVAGKIALIIRGECEFVAKANVIASAGAVGMVVVDNCRVTQQCDPGSAPIMSIGDAEASPKVYDMVAIAVTEQIGVNIVSLALTEPVSCKIYHETMLVNHLFAGPIRPENSSDNAARVAICLYRGLPKPSW